eukprot:5285511-Alexandrium_andersonii.AAC.1
MLVAQRVFDSIIVAISANQCHQSPSAVFMSTLMCSAVLGLCLAGFREQTGLEQLSLIVDTAILANTCGIGIPCCILYQSTRLVCLKVVFRNAKSDVHCRVPDC